MDYVCALDAGTTGVRAVAVDTRGTAIAQRYAEITQSFPRPGWVEHDAAEIATKITAAAAALIDDLGTLPAAIGITNQRETVVAWDRRSGEPLHAAIVWQDRRGAARCDELRRDHLDLIRQTTGLIPDPYFSATKLEWLFQNVDLGTGDHLAVGTIDSWLLWHLTGGAVHATEPSNAARTMLFDIEALTWSPRLCDIFGVPPRALPDIRPTAGRFGTTRSVSGIADGIPISGIAGDQQSSLFGQRCFTPGMAKNTYGTGSFVLMNVGTKPPAPTDGLLGTVAWKLGDEPTVYAAEGSIFSTGSAVQWLRDGLGIISEAAELEPLAASCADAQGAMFVPAFTGLGSPWWDPDARGTMVGITRGTGRAQLARAIIDAMVFQTRDVTDTMVSATGRDLEEFRVDGGAAAMNLLCRLQADQLATPVVRAASLETTALGAAFLAGLAEGVWADTQELTRVVEPGERFLPVAEPDDAAFARWHRAVDRARSEPLA